MGEDTIPTRNEALVQLSPRGTTPLREVGNPNIHPDYCGSTESSEAYMQLLVLR